MESRINGAGRTGGAGTQHCLAVGEWIRRAVASASLNGGSLSVQEWLMVEIAPVGERTSLIGVVACRAGVVNNQVKSRGRREGGTTRRDVVESLGVDFRL